MSVPSYSTWWTIWKPWLQFQVSLVNWRERRFDSRGSRENVYLLWSCSGRNYRALDYGVSAVTRTYVIWLFRYWWYNAFINGCYCGFLEDLVTFYYVQFCDASHHSDTCGIERSLVQHYIYNQRMYILSLIWYFEFRSVFLSALSWSHVLMYRLWIFAFIYFHEFVMHCYYKIIL